VSRLLCLWAGGLAPLPNLLDQLRELMLHGPATPRASRSNPYAARRLSVNPSKELTSDRPPKGTAWRSGCRRLSSLPLPQ
jgi:hypothetical protein